MPEPDDSREQRADDWWRLSEEPGGEEDVFLELETPPEGPPEPPVAPVSADQQSEPESVEVKPAEPKAAEPDVARAEPEQAPKPEGQGETQPSGFQEPGPAVPEESGSWSVEIPMEAVPTPPLQEPEWPKEPEGGGQEGEDDQPTKGYEPTPPVVSEPRDPEPHSEPVPEPSPAPKPTPEPAAPEPKVAPPATADVTANKLVEVLRTGTGVSAPTDVVALLVITETPQRVRRGQVITLREARTLVGRGRKAACLLDDPNVEDYHAVVNFERHEDGAGFFLHPVSTRGVEINGGSVYGAARLRSGDRVHLGATEMVFFQTDLARGAS